MPTQAIVQPTRNKYEAFLIEHAELPYILLFLFGVFLLFQYKSWFGVILMVLSLIVLSHPKPYYRPSDDAKIAWDEYADSGIGTAHMVKHYEETISYLDHLGITNDSIFTSKHFRAYITPNKASRVDVTYLRRFPKPGESRFAGHRASSILDTAMSDVVKDLEELDRLEEPTFEDKIRDVKKMFGVKTTKELKEAIS